MDRYVRSAMPLPSEVSLPTLREDLTVVDGQVDESGNPTWVVYDALRHRHYRIDGVAREILSVWRDCRTLEELHARISARGTTAVEVGDIEKIIQFLKYNKLCRSDADGTWQALAVELQYLRGSIASYLFHNYLFFRIPLWQPQSFLLRSLPHIRWLAHPAVIALVLGLGLLGLYLTSRQWDAFVSTFQYAFRWEGAVSALICLVVVKCCHELGHAYAAVNFGARVPTIGVAFMMLTPMLYADISDTWQLRDQRQRASVALAGVLVEAAIACLAILAWSFLPEGPIRSAAFFLSVVSLVGSLFINLNPLMRFDGYHLLSDVLGVDNLQERSFALARWKLREWLFGWEKECEEQLPLWMHNFFIGFAIATWVYRFFLFLGIALLVYHFCFKALGLVLFAVEIWYFIARPVVSEVKIWWQERKEIRSQRRFRYSAAALCLMILGFVYPWSSRVELQAIVEPAEFVRVYAPRAAKVVDVAARSGQYVNAGDVLVRLEAPELDKEIALSRVQLRLAKLQFARRIADASDREESLELERRISALNLKISGFLKEQEEFVVRAPLSGSIVELNGELHGGRWLSTKELLVAIAVPDRLVARGYVAEGDLGRLSKDSEGMFVSDAAQRPVMKGRIAEIGLAGSKDIEILELASQYGGRVGVQSDDKRRLIPVVAQYPVRLVFTESAGALDLINRGVVVLSGKPESLAGRVGRNIAAVLIRESGF